MWELLVYDVITFSGVSRLIEARAGLLESPPPTGKGPQSFLSEPGTVLQGGTWKGDRGKFLERRRLQQRVLSVLSMFCV